MGDFKLKTAPDYVVPEHLRMDTEKKRLQILTLQGIVSRLLCSMVDCTRRITQMRVTSLRDPSPRYCACVERLSSQSNIAADVVIR